MVDQFQIRFHDELHDGIRKVTDDVLVTMMMRPGQGAKWLQVVLHCGILNVADQFGTFAHEVVSLRIRSRVARIWCGYT